MTRERQTLGPALPMSFYARETLTVARELIGATLVREQGGVQLSGRIVETEAYREDDPASHSFRGPTKRCRLMFGAPGFAYLYLSYGVHHCLNVVTEPEGAGCAVLIRALEPIEAAEMLWSRRFPGRLFDSDRDCELTNGPGKLTAAFGITIGEFNGHRLDAPPLSIHAPVTQVAAVLDDVRIGISRGTEKRWRFYEAGNRYARLPVGLRRRTGRLV